ncbi:MAG: porin [Pseudomonadota bacterium]
MKKLLLSTTALAGAGLLSLGAAAGTVAENDSGVTLSIDLEVKSTFANASSDAKPGDITLRGSAAGADNTLNSDVSDDNLNQTVGAKSGQRQKTGQTTDWNLGLTAAGMSDSGIAYQAVLKFEENTSTLTKDEVYVSFSGGFGTITLGEDDPASDGIRMGEPAVGGADADWDRYIRTREAATVVDLGQLDNTADLSSPFTDPDDEPVAEKSVLTSTLVKHSSDFLYGDDANGIKYAYSGDVGQGSLSFAASFTPSSESQATNADNVKYKASGYRDVLSAGLSFTQNFGGGSASAWVAMNKGDARKANNLATTYGREDLDEIGYGVQFAFNNFTVGALMIDSGDSGYSKLEATTANNARKAKRDDREAVGIGAKYTMGSWSFGINHREAEGDAYGLDGKDKSSATGVGVSYAMAPGWTIFADAVKFDHDPAGGTVGEIADGVIADDDAKAKAARLINTAAAKRNDNDGTVLLLGTAVKF